MDIYYTNSVENIQHNQLQGFFVDWPTHPSPERHVEILHASHGVELAIDTETNQVVGFITVISDGILAGYIPLLEVLPEYQGKGVGKELVNRITARYENLYMLDVCCDDSVIPIYADNRFLQVAGMVKRNYERQSATEPECIDNSDS